MSAVLTSFGGLTYNETPCRALVPIRVVVNTYSLRALMPADYGIQLNTAVFASDEVFKHAPFDCDPCGLTRALWLGF